jgi:hypothetical protein
LLIFLLPVTAEIAQPQAAAAGQLRVTWQIFLAQDFDFALVGARALIANQGISLIQPNSFVVLIHGERFIS